MDALQIVEIVASVLGGSGIGFLIRWLLDKLNKRKQERIILDKHSKRIDWLIRGMLLNMNAVDVVIDAMREGKCNGETEAVQEKMHEFERECIKENLGINSFSEVQGY